MSHLERELVIMKHFQLSRKFEIVFHRLANMGTPSQLSKSMKKLPACCFIRIAYAMELPRLAINALDFTAHAWKPLHSRRIDRIDCTKTVLENRLESIWHDIFYQKIHLAQFAASSLHLNCWFKKSILYLICKPKQKENAWPAMSYNSEGMCTFTCIVDRDCTHGVVFQEHLAEDSLESAIASPSWRVAQMKAPYRWMCDRTTKVALPEYGSLRRFPIVLNALQDAGLFNIRFRSEVFQKCATLQK